MTQHFIGKVEIPEVPDITPIEPQDIIDLFYPIGHLYLSKNNTSPAELFGGTWTQLENVFLRAANDTNTGGSDNVTLTVAQLASHNHSNVRGQGAGSGFNYVYTSKGLSSSFAFANTGSNQAHSNMPAYQNVYCWRRVS